MSDEPRRRVRVVLDMEISGDTARNQMMAERAAFTVVSLETKEWRYRDRTTTTAFWGRTADISWRLLDWSVMGQPGESEDDQRKAITDKLE